MTAPRTLIELVANVQLPSNRTYAALIDGLVLNLSFGVSQSQIHRFCHEWRIPVDHFKAVALEYMLYAETDREALIKGLRETFHG